MIGRAWGMLRTLAREVRLNGAQARADSGKGYFRQTCEILWLRKRGFNTKDYYVLELHRHDANGYMGSLDYGRVNRYLNPRHTGVVPFNKWVMAVFLHGAGIPVPRNLGVLHYLWGWRQSGAPLKSVDDFRELLAGISDGVVCKPLDGGKGQGVLVLTSYDPERDMVQVASGRELRLPECWAELADDPQGYLVQGRLKPHRVLHRVYGGSVNTVRISTVIDDDGNVDPQLAVFRVGSGGSAIDNMSAGGLAAMVDLESGRCGAAVRMHGSERHAHHPDTGAMIEGLTIPEWQDIVDIARRAHSVLPFPRTLGWDVALTEDGPVIIEVNGNEAVVAFQKTGWRLLDGPLGRICVD